MMEPPYSRVLKRYLCCDRYQRYLAVEGLQMSYNLCNLPKQITTVNGKTVKYTYFADGTKHRKSIALV